MPAAQGSAGNAKEAILDAAMRVFARYGYEGASLPRIAEAAEVAHPLIHYHFGSKENLWRETVGHASRCGLTAELAAIEAASRSLPVLDRFRVLIQGLTRSAARYPEPFRLLMAEARSESDRLKWIRENYTDAFMARLHALLRDAQESGHIKKMPVENISSVLMGAVLFHFSFHPRALNGEDLEEASARHAECIAEMLLNGVAAEYCGAP